MTWPLHICREYSTRLDRMFSFLMYKKFEWRWQLQRWTTVSLDDLDDESECSDMMNSFERCCFEHIWSGYTSTSSIWWLFRSVLTWSVPEALFQVLVSPARTHTRWISPRIYTLIRLDDKKIRCPFCKLALQALSSVDRSSLSHKCPGISFLFVRRPNLLSNSSVFFMFNWSFHIKFSSVHFSSTKCRRSVFYYLPCTLWRNHPFFGVVTQVATVPVSVSVLSSFLYNTRICDCILGFTGKRAQVFFGNNFQLSFGFPQASGVRSHRTILSRTLLPWDRSSRPVLK